MIRIAIVEDEITASDLLIDYLNKYANEKKEKFEIKVYSSSLMFLNEYKNNLDIVFMDIELPDGNGLDTIRKIRQLDNDVIVIFVTNMAQYAVKGYEVRAFDFIVKPVTYYNFSVKLENVLHCFEKKKDSEIWISNKEGKLKLKVSSIYYIEVVQHMCFYHTSNGNFKATGSLKNIEDTLEKMNFALCNRCYLVNLKYVTSVKKGIVVVNNEELIISRSKQAEFMKRLNDYLAEGD